MDESRVFGILAAAEGLDVEAWQLELARREVRRVQEAEGEERREVMARIGEAVLAGGDLAVATAGRGEEVKGVSAYGRDADGELEGAGLLPATGDGAEGVAGEADSGDLVSAADRNGQAAATAEEEPDAGTANGMPAARPQVRNEGVRVCSACGVAMTLSMYPRADAEMCKPCTRKAGVARLKAERGGRPREEVEKG